MLSPRHARAVTLLSAIDTGEWTTLCNSSWRSAEGTAAWKEGGHGVRREEGADASSREEGADASSREEAADASSREEGADASSREEGAGGSPSASLGAPFHAPYTPVCDAYNFTLGTLEHFDHLILANLHCAPRSPHAHMHTPPAAQPLVCRQGPLAPAATCTLHHGRLESLVAREPRRSP